MMVVLVANTKGGCGKTTVATHLAAALAVVATGPRWPMPTASARAWSGPGCAPAPRRRSPRSTGRGADHPPRGTRSAGHRGARGDEEEARVRAGGHGRRDRRAGAALGVRSRLDRRRFSTRLASSRRSARARSRSACCATGCARTRARRPGSPGSSPRSSTPTWARSPTARSTTRSPPTASRSSTCRKAGRPLWEKTWAAVLDYVARGAALDGHAEAQRRRLEHRPLHQDGAIDAGRAVVGAADLAQDRAARLGGLGIDRDHLAARIALEHGDHHLARVAAFCRRIRPRRSRSRIRDPGRRSRESVACRPERRSRRRAGAPSGSRTAKPGGSRSSPARSAPG